MKTIKANTRRKILNLEFKKLPAEKTPGPEGWLNSTKCLRKK